MSDKKRLTESFSKDWAEPLAINKLPIKETADKIVHEGKEYKPLAEWEIPVWRLNKKNLNGRTYRESLGRRVEENCKNLVTAALADHPEGDSGGSVNNILAVSKNPHVREGILWVNTTIVDEAFEKKLEKMTEAGYGLGVSSSVFGDIDSDGNVIDESVEVERYFDFVLDPSYQVYVTKENKVHESTEKSEDKILIKEENKGENKAMDDNRQEAMEKAYRLNIKGLMNGADKLSLTEKISAYEDISASVGNAFPDIKESVDKKLNDLRKEAITLAEKAVQVDKLTEDVATKESEKTSLKESLDKLTKEKEAVSKKYEEACSLLDELKEKYNKSLIVIESQAADIGSRFTAKEYEKIIESYSSVKNNNKKLAENCRNLEKSLEENKKEIASLKEKISDTPKKVVQESRKVIEHKDELKLDTKNDKEVKNYYYSLCESDSNYKKEEIREKILGCKTVFEAQMLALKLKNESATEKMLDNNIHSDGNHLFESINDDGFDYTVGGSLHIR